MAGEDEKAFLMIGNQQFTYLLILSIFCSYCIKIQERKIIRIHVGPETLVLLLILYFNLNNCVRS
jgi:hypothetical protein